MSDQKKENFEMASFRRRTFTNPRYGDRIWRLLEHAILQIFHQDACGLSFEELYRNAYNMVLHKFGDKLYSGLVATMTSHVKEIARSVEATQGDSFLEELNRKWYDHIKALQMVRDVLMYMDRTYVQTTQKAPVYQLGLNLWKENVIYSIQIKTRLLSTLLELVRSERTGDVVNRGLIRNITKMLMDLGPSVYEREFEAPFLIYSADFYKFKSQKFIQCGDCGDYLKIAERSLNEETDRVSHYLDPVTEKKITRLVEQELIENHMHRLIHMENSGLVNMLSDDKYDDVGRMYNLFSRVTGGLSKICEVMISHIIQSGRQLVTDPERLKDPIELVQRILDDKDKYDKILNLAFNCDKLFEESIKSAFTFYINLNPHSPVYISLFVDDKLRKGLKGVSEDDIEITLDKVMMLFRYLEEKDVFEKYYRQHLAKRLLSGQTVSDDAERSLIVKLKTQSGSEFTAKLEVMFNDMKTSLDTMQGFSARHPELGDGPTLNVQVLTAGCWPTRSNVTCNLPAELTVICEKFRSYYLSIHNGRKLSWQTNLGTADLIATFGKGQKHELNVSTNQMCVLMLFNNADRLSYKEIEQATEIPASDLKKCLQSLALVKGRNVLRKEPMSKDITYDDAFFVNDNFSNKLYKVKIGNLASKKESELEILETRQKVEVDRKPQIDAAIVRIMKSRKLHNYKSLISDVTMQLQPRFLVNPADIKRRIESLLEREFLARDDGDRRVIRYVA